MSYSQTGSGLVVHEIILAYEAVVSPNLTSQYLPSVVLFG
jgi:hypothetical protein